MKTKNHCTLCHEVALNNSHIRERLKFSKFVKHNFHTNVFWKKLLVKKKSTNWKQFISHAIIRESGKAIEILETNYIEACLFTVQELGYINQYTDKFVQQQLRQTRLNIKWKDIFFDKMAHSLVQLKILLKEKLRNDIYCQVIKQLTNNHKRSIYYSMMECNDFVFTHFPTISRVGKLFGSAYSINIKSEDTDIYWNKSKSFHRDFLEEPPELLAQPKSINNKHLKKKINKSELQCRRKDKNIQFKAN
ncbi:hypothetical protein RFI_28247 [Reticulomyxa filosa]|uniref:Uncharacterized protein n=1 Tax=Reticulomyxa filosa TaxID=46433 RepID=X6M7Y4_RETFI|nr:hypothetical protein RFI_28247 [Reticulomyxa filosa]|eukprot:ETO09140.1 hypothetical protein RFI_28247 [Reticulomyxa filosa]